MAFHHEALPRRIYRVSYGDNPLAYAPLAVLAAGEPGRWDDPKYRFRTGYFADSLATCYIEILAALRPDPAVVAVLEAMGEAPAAPDIAIAQRLQHRYASVVIVPHEDPIVDILHARSRAEFEHRARRRKKTKAGDFLSRDTKTSRRAAGIVYDAGEIGVAAPSAEAFALRYRAMTFNIFEATLNANVARIDLVTHTTAPATAERIALAAARDFLGIEQGLSTKLTDLSAGNIKSQGLTDQADSSIVSKIALARSNAHRTFSASFHAPLPRWERL